MEATIAIPIYNAQKFVEKSVTQIINFLPEDFDYEIVLRDDGSTDSSPEIIKSLAEKYEKVRCSFNGTNQGLGYTLKEMFKEAKGDYITYLDCDLPFGSNIIPRLIKEVKSSDIVVVSRYTKEEHKPQPIPLKGRIKPLRKTLSYIYYRLAKFMFDIPIRDIGSGTMAMKRKVAETLDIKANGFDFHIEYYVRAVEHNFQIKEITAPTQHIEKGTFKILKHGSEILVQTLKFWREIKKERSTAPRAKTV